jgi:hypothetical protein
MDGAGMISPPRLANFIARLGMSALSELVPEAKSLSRIDKLRLIQLLAAELAGDEGSDIKASGSYPVWSPSPPLALRMSCSKPLPMRGNLERARELSTLPPTPPTLRP